MPLPGLDYQLQLDLDLPEEATGQDGRALTAEEIRLRSETARQALEVQRGVVGAPQWLEEYFRLREHSWPWRVAAFIAWSASPRQGRRPDTQDELAQLHLGLTSDRQIAEWRKNNPTINEMIGLMQSAPLFEHRRDIYEALIDVATAKDYKGHNDRKLALELLGDYIPTAKLAALISKRAQAGDLAELSDDELTALGAAMAMEEGKRAENDGDPENAG